MLEETASRATSFLGRKSHRVRPLALVIPLCSQAKPGHHEHSALSQRHLKASPATEDGRGSREVIRWGAQANDRCMSRGGVGGRL